MAYPTLRSMNADLWEGATDGRYKKIVMDRGGVVDPLTHHMRDEMDDVWHGFHEKKVKDVPTIGDRVTPNYVAFPEPDMTRW